VCMFVCADATAVACFVYFFFYSFCFSIPEVDSKFIVDDKVGKGLKWEEYNIVQSVED